MLQDGAKDIRWSLSLGQQKCACFTCAAVTIFRLVLFLANWKEGLEQENVNEETIWEA